MSAVYAWLSRHPRLVDGVPAFWLALFGVATVKAGSSATALQPSGVIIHSREVPGTDSGGIFDSAFFQSDDEG